MTPVHQIPADEALDWILWRDFSGCGTGFHVGGWESSVWVLHAIYEDETLPGGLTHDDVDRAELAELAAGTVEPLVINQVDVDEMPGLVHTGCELGRTERPTPAGSGYVGRTSQPAAVSSWERLPGGRIPTGDFDGSGFAFEALWGTKISGEARLTVALLADDELDGVERPF